ncbi:MAG: hypothetical protein ACHRXM_34590 [Isosphaerales bacterium]
MRDDDSPRHTSFHSRALMMDHPAKEQTAIRSSWPCRTPLLIAAVLIGLISGFNLIRLVRAAAPRNPWESIEIVEAWRSVHGMPVYDLSPRGHATHMYGAFVPWVQGELFRWIGPNNVSGRVLSLVSALVTVTLLAVGLRGERSAWYLAVAWAAILGVNHRSGQYFAENRPDMTALMFATAAVLLFASGQERRRGPSVVLGSACLVVGFFFKQSVTIFSVVPLVALILRWRRPRSSEVLLALFPLAVVVGAILGLRFLSPTVYHYMIEVPGAYSINWPRATKFLWELLLDSPLFLVLLAEWLLIDDGSLPSDPRVVWLLAALAVAIPFSAVSHAKVGGWPNSLLPALLPMMAFCILRLPRLLKRLDNPARPLPSRLMFASFLALLLLMTTFPHLTYANGLIVSASPWDQAYWKAVALARELPGTVVCPEDPTIPLHAKRYAGQNFFSEKDAHPLYGRWPVAMPERVLAEIGGADYVVDVTNYWGENINEKLLEDLGFEPAEDVVLDPACYTIWRRKPVEGAADPGRTRLTENRGPVPARSSTR